MGSPDFWEMVGWALACSVPVVLIGGVVIRLARTWSLAVSMVALVLIPVGNLRLGRRRGRRR